ncbi:MAG TPA: hypothetical protein VGC77_06885 [Rhodopseudomonas sp.]
MEGRLRLLNSGAAAFCFVLSIGAAFAGDWEQSSGWYIETKRVAKFARIAITSTGDLARMDAEEAAARKQLASASGLPLPDQARAICAASAKAVVDFIGAAKAGNMTNGPASYERQYQRWDTLSDQCISAIQQRASANR